MKKLSVIIALVLLAVAGTGYAVSCAYDNVPGATLLVPYWRVSLNGATGAPIPSGGVDTLVSMINVSTPGLIAHVTVWNKYSRAVLDFNVPMTGKDVVAFSMRDIMNGKLNVNYTQVNNFLGSGTGDPCGVNLSKSPAVYQPLTGFGAQRFIRFSHPEAISGPGSDAFGSISVYLPDAFGGFRNRVWDSLDESGDITSLTSSSGANILDFDNPACFGSSNGDGVFKTDLSGYLTIDVVNYCTNYFPENTAFYDEDAIATDGWELPRGCDASAPELGRCTQAFTPNALIGDIFYIDTASQGGNISGDQAIAIEWSPELEWTAVFFPKTFFGKFVSKSVCPGETFGTGCSTGFAANVPVAFRFAGDGREPLGSRYGFRYLNDQTAGLQTWILVWRSDSYNDTDGAGDPTDSPTNNLCDWLAAGGPKGSGLYDDDHQLIAAVYDNDENSFTTGGPSGSTSLNKLYVFLETQRISLLGNGDLNPSGFKGGWVDAQFQNPGATFAYNDLFGVDWNQAWVGVQHTAPGAFLSVGHSAAELLNDNFEGNCIFFSGGVPMTRNVPISTRKAMPSAK
jgi:hypothetical protein